MKREIKFRAKSVETDEWIEGYYVQLAGFDYIVPFNQAFRYITDADIENSFEEVDAKTLSQWIGFSDKNGVEIYEGDIVIFGKLSTVIKYFDKYGMFGLVGKSKYRKHDENEPMGSGGSSTSYKPYVLSEYYQRRMEVIGNIHDYPELLK